MTEKEKLAIMYNCARMLMFNSILTGPEYDKVVNRIIRFRDSHGIKITEEDLDSVEFKIKSDEQTR